MRGCGARSRRGRGAWGPVRSRRGHEMCRCDDESHLNTRAMNSIKCWSWAVGLRSLRCGTSYPGTPTASPLPTVWNVTVVRVQNGSCEGCRARDSPSTVLASHRRWPAAKVSVGGPVACPHMNVCITFCRSRNQIRIKESNSSRRPLSVRFVQLPRPGVGSTSSLGNLKRGSSRSFHPLPTVRSEYLALW